MLVDAVASELEGTAVEVASKTAQHLVGSEEEEGASEEDLKTLEALAWTGGASAETRLSMMSEWKVETEARHADSPALETRRSRPAASAATASIEPQAL